MPKSDRDIDIFEYCQYVMGAFEFHELLIMNWVLSALKQSQAFCRIKMKLFVFYSG